MADRSRQAHATVVAALKADATVAGLVGTRVYDRVPQTVTFPFISVMSEISGPFDGTNLDGSEIVLRLDIWSRSGGRSGEAYNIAAAARDALHNQNLTMSAGSLINCRLLDGGQQVRRDDDTRSVQVIQRYRIVTQD